MVALCCDPLTPTSVRRILSHAADQGLIPRGWVCSETAWREFADASVETSEVITEKSRQETIGGYPVRTVDFIDGAILLCRLR